MQSMPLLALAMDWSRPSAERSDWLSRWPERLKLLLQLCLRLRWAAPRRPPPCSPPELEDAEDCEQCPPALPVAALLPCWRSENCTPDRRALALSTGVSSCSTDGGVGGGVGGGDVPVFAATIAALTAAMAAGDGGDGGEGGRKDDAGTITGVVMGDAGGDGGGEGAILLRLMKSMAFFLLESSSFSFVVGDGAIATAVATAVMTALAAAFAAGDGGVGGRSGSSGSGTCAESSGTGCSGSGVDGRGHTRGDAGSAPGL